MTPRPLAGDHLQDHALPDTSIDQFLGGQIEVEQPIKGRHRSGLDAVLLAAAVPSDAHGALYDLGAGAGVAGMAAVNRIPGLSAVLVEQDKVMRSLAARTLLLKANSHIARRVSILEADVIAKGSERHACGLTSGCANHVVINPPFYAGNRVSSSPAEDKAKAHILAKGGLEPWIRTAADILATGGTLTLVFHAGGVAEILSALKDRFGSIILVPVFPRQGMAATRLIVQGVRGSRAPVEIRRGLVLHGPTGGSFLPEAEAIQRHGTGLDLNSL